MLPHPRGFSYVGHTYVYLIGPVEVIIGGGGGGPEPSAYELESESSTVAGGVVRRVRAGNTVPARVSS